MTQPRMFHELTWAVRRLQSAATRATQVLAHRLDMVETDLEALQQLAAQPGRLGPADLGRLLGIRSASATVLVDRLENAGHVRRVAHPTDGRRRVIELTDHSRRTVLAELTRLTSAIDDIARAVAPEHAAATAQFLLHAAAALEEFAHPPSPTPT